MQWVAQNRELEVKQYRKMFHVDVTHFLVLERELFQVTSNFVENLFYLLYFIWLQENLCSDRKKVNVVYYLWVLEIFWALIYTELHSLYLKIKAKVTTWTGASFADLFVCVHFFQVHSFSQIPKFLHIVVV